MVWTNLLIGLAGYCLLTSAAIKYRDLDTPFWLEERRPGATRWIVVYQYLRSRRALALASFLCVAAVLSARLALPPAVFGSALAALAFLGIVFHKVQANRVRLRVQEQIGGVLESLAGALVYDSSIVRALKSAEELAEPPIKGDLKRTILAIDTGIGAEAALTDLAIKLDSELFSLAVHAVIVCRETGGDISTMLCRLAGAARSRIAIRRKIYAATSQQRLTVVMVSSMPVVFLATAYALNPSYIAFYTTPIGFAAFGYAAVSIGLGIFWLYRLVDILPKAGRC